MTIVVIGADGQLGTDLIKQDKKIVPLIISDIDITDIEQSRYVLGKIRPEVVINTAAYNRVDDCEDEPDPAFAINAIAVSKLALVCKEIKSSLVHISTDYVFSGDSSKPYCEEDAPHPKSIYGISKLAGEYALRYILDQYYIIRTSGLFGAAGCLGKGGSNFIEAVIKRAKSGAPVQVVNDEIVSPTYTYDLAKKILEILAYKNYGIYHVVNEGCCSWHDFAKKIFDFLQIDVGLLPVSGEQFKSKARRPKYSVLEKTKLKELGLDNLRTWDQALQAYLKEKRYIS